MKELLEKIGLTPGEAEVYQVLVEMGVCSAGTIVKKASIASSKVYDVLQRLINKGLASYSIKNGVRYYDATPPERLIDFLEEKRESIKHVETEIEKLIPTIKLKRSSLKDTNEVIVYTGPQGAKIALKESIDAGRKGAELCGYGTDEDPYKDILPAAIEEHFRDQKKYKIKWKLLFTKGKWKSPSPIAEIKYLPKGFNVPIRTMIMGDKVAIVDFSPPITTIIIHKKEIAKGYKKHFDFLWKIAKK